MQCLVTLAQDFEEDDCFETFLHYVDEHQWARAGAEAEAEGQDREEVEFIPPSGEGDGLEGEATNPLDAEA